MDVADRALLNSVLIAFVVAGLTFMAARYWYARRAIDEKDGAIAEATLKLTQRVNELESEHALVKASVVPITTAFQQLLIQKLTHFHEPETDRLLEKIAPGLLTVEEEARLAVLLGIRTRDMGDQITESERRAARILPDVMFLAKEVQEEIARESALAIVAVPKPKANGPIAVPAATDDDTGDVKTDAG